MGGRRDSRVIVLIVLLGLVCLFVHRQPTNRTDLAQTSLRSAVSQVPGWEAVAFVPIDQGVLSTLDLDDYVNQVYRSGNRRIDLFIGYYRTAQKVGAVHSPLVCFPGQGWAISESEQKTLRMGENTVHFSSMVVSKGDREELILYWFQAYDRTSPGTLLQKVYLVLSRLLKNREGNAFVRVSVPVNDDSMEEAMHTGEMFIRSFYPGFLAFLKDESI